MFMYNSISFYCLCSCKEFMEVAEDDYISEHIEISINKFPVLIKWLPVNDKRVSFLTRCFNKGNSDALFRRGMVRSNSFRNTRKHLLIIIQKYTKVKFLIFFIDRVFYVG